MINGVHALVYAKEAGKTRRFFKDVMGWSNVDAGHGWLIFALPPAEIAAHPAGQGGEPGRCDLYFMCDDIEETVEQLKKKGVEITQPIANRGWGLVTAMAVPGLGEVGLYQPRHPIAYKRPAARKVGTRKARGAGRGTQKAKR